MDQADAIAAVITSAHRLGWHLQDLTWSPLTGPSGNVEYLAWFNTLERQGEPELQQTGERSQILALTTAAQADLHLSG